MLRGLNWRSAVAAALALSFVSAAPSLAAQNWKIAPAPPWIDSVPVPSTPSVQTQDLSAGVHYLLSDHQAKVGKGTSAQFYRWVRKVTSTSGLQGAAEVRMTFDPAYQKLVIHHIRLTRASGETVNALHAGDVKIIQDEDGLEQQIYDESLTALTFLKDVRVGDTIDYAYTVLGQNPVLDGKFVDTLELAYSVPVSMIRHRIVWPAARTLYHKAHSTKTAPIIQTQGADTIYVWEQKDAEAYVAEDSAPDWFDPQPWVQLTEFASWAEVATWSARLFAGSSQSSPEIDRLASSFKSLGSDEERARAAVRMVQDEVRYLGIEIGPNSHQPHSPAQVLDQKFGDCKDKALLLSVLLGKIGIAAVPVLVNTEAKRGLDEWLPTPFAFDHSIVQVRIGGKTLWIDGTQSQQGGLLTAASNPPYERALLVRDGETGLTPIEPTKAGEPTTVVEETFTLPVSGTKAELRVLTTYTGDDADAMRAGLESQSPAERARGYLNFYARKDPKIRALEAPVLTDKRDANVITVAEHYELPGFWDEGGRWFRPWPIVDRVEKPNTTLRTSPLAVAYPMRVRYRVRFEGLPYRPESVDAAEVNDKAFRFSRTSDWKDNAFTLTYDYAALSDAVAPADVAGHLAHIDDLYEEVDYYLDAAPPSPLGRRAGRRDSGAAANQMAKWLGLAAGSLLFAALMRVGFITFRNRRRRITYTAQQKYAWGAAPHTALRVGNADEARERLGGLTCGCGAVIRDDGEWSTCRYDGRTMTIVARHCLKCLQTQTVYLDLPPEQTAKA